MESTNLPGKIQMTEITHNALQGNYITELRGTISVKGRGEMKTFFLKGRKQHTQKNCSPIYNTFNARESNPTSFSKSSYSGGNVRYSFTGGSLIRYSFSGAEKTSENQPATHASTPGSEAIDQTRSSKLKLNVLQNEV